MKFIVHDSYGNILSTGDCSEQDFALQATGSNSVVVDIWDGTSDRFHCMENGVRRDRSVVGRLPWETK